MYDIEDKDFNQNEQLDHNKDVLNLELEGFNGPLDLLLNLAQTKKVDITKISILALVDQYIDFIKKTKQTNLDLASDYLVMAAILAYIKSKLLIPEQKSEGDDNNELPEILEFNLKRLKAMRINAERLFNRDLLFEKRFLKGFFSDQSIQLETEYYCNKNSLLICFSNIFNRKEAKEIIIRTEQYYTTEFAIKRIRELYEIFKDWTPLAKFIPDIKNFEKNKKSLRIALISVISASLELVKNGEILIMQKKEGGDIFLRKSKRKK